MDRLQGLAGNCFRHKQKQGRILLESHRYANAAGMSCAAIACRSNVGFRAARRFARECGVPASRRISTRIFNTTTVISNKEAEA